MIALKANWVMVTGVNTFDYVAGVSNPLYAQAIASPFMQKGKIARVYKN